MNENNFLKELGKRIKTSRIAANMTQKDLAQKMGYKSVSTIAKIESGINDIPQSKIMDFAEVLNVSPAYVMGWDEAIDKSVVEIEKEVDRLSIASENHRKIDPEALKAYLSDQLSKHMSIFENISVSDYINFIEKPELSLEELAMIYKFRGLDERGKKTVNNTLNNEYDLMNEKKVLKVAEEVTTYDSTIPIAASGSEGADEDELKRIQEDIDDL